MEDEEEDEDEMGAEVVGSGDVLVEPADEREKCVLSFTRYFLTDPDTCQRWIKYRD